MRILIVDDSKAMQVIVQRSVEQLDINKLEINYAFDGLEALDVVRTWEPDLVIADWHMPELSGYGLLLALNREMLPIRIGFVTTETSESKLQQAFDAGAEFVVNKPFTTLGLVEVLNPIIDDIKKRKSTDEDDSVEGSRAAPSEKGESPARIVMPKDSTLQKALNALCEQNIQMINVETHTLNEEWLPSVVGVFVDAEEGFVHGICVVDFIAAMCLTGVLAGLTNASIKKLIKKREIPTDIINKLERAFEVISVTIYDNANNCELNFKSMSMINTDMNKLEALLGRRNTQRADFELTIEGFDSGKLIVVSS